MEQIVIRPTRTNGAALVTVLVITSVTVVLVISLLSVTQSELRISGYHLRSSEARMAANSGFREVCKVIEELTKSDGYLVTSLTDSSDEQPVRYTFISTANPNGITHAPLFSGGAVLRDVTVDRITSITKEALLEQSPILPHISWQDLGAEPERLLISYGLSHIRGHQEQGFEVVGESRSPPVQPLVVSSMESSGSGSSNSTATKYAYWVEDLQGYPSLERVNLEKVGNGEAAIYRYLFNPSGAWTLDPEDSNQIICLDQRRTIESLSMYGVSDLQIAFPSHTGVFRDSMVQQNFGAVAPGLSPRSLFLHTWDSNTGGYAPQIDMEHPYHDVHRILGQPLSSRQLGLLAASQTTENRFARNLQPYAYRPLIPYHHGYLSDSLSIGDVTIPGEGDPKFQLNRLLSSLDRGLSVETITDVIGLNMPDFFDSRKGGFPEVNATSYLDALSSSSDSEDGAVIVDVEELDSNGDGENDVFHQDYAKTIAANILDYADNDSVPTFDSSYRGIDGFLPVNEIFFKLQYRGFIVDPVNSGRLIARFEGTPFVEFWNPFNQTILMEALKIKFRLIETFRISPPDFSDADDPDFRLDLENNIVEDNAFNVPITNVRVEPNAYQVVRFNKIVWDIPVDAGISDSLIISSVISESATKTTRMNYELYVGGADIEAEYGGFILIDRCNRPYQMDDLGLADGAGGANKPRFGIHMHAFNGQGPAASYNGYTSGQLLADDFMIRSGFPSAIDIGSSYGKGSFHGDPFLQFYGRWTALGKNEWQYQRNSSPGSRNYSDRDVIREQTLVRAWPDGGFDNDATPSLYEWSANEAPDPDSFGTSPSDPGRAPFRMSNLGRYFSTTELGNIHDPMMWVVCPKNFNRRLEFLRRGVSGQKFNSSSSSPNPPIADQGDYMWEGLANYQDPSKSDAEWVAYPSYSWGGGNTLRVGRKEHEIFDKEGVRACQLLDLFQVGENGTNFDFGEMNGDIFSKSLSDNRYDGYSSDLHYLPPTAINESEAGDKPFVDLYGEQNPESRDYLFHAEGDYKRVHGHLNINTIPTKVEMECLLRGPLIMSDVLVTSGTRQIDVSDVAGGLEIERPVDESLLRNSYNEAAISAIADGVMQARPFASKSHLAQVLNELVHDNAPDTTLHPDAAGDRLYFANDAQREELTARVLNQTTLASRHFRIFSVGEVVAVDGAGNELQTLARSNWVYEVFMQPVRDLTGNVVESRCVVLSSREL